jgi:hypothetical protein
MAYRVVHAEPDLGGVPVPLRDLVARCLAKEPASRPSLPRLMLADRPGGGDGSGLHAAGERLLRQLRHSLHEGQAIPGGEFRGRLRVREPHHVVRLGDRDRDRMVISAPTAPVGRFAYDGLVPLPQTAVAPILLIRAVSLAVSVRCGVTSAAGRP